MTEMIFNCEVFDPEGRFLGSFPLKVIMFIMTLVRDKLYMVEADSESNPCLRRYQIIRGI